MLDLSLCDVTHDTAAQLSLCSATQDELASSRRRAERDAFYACLRGHGLDEGDGGVLIFSERVVAAVGACQDV